MLLIGSLLIILAAVLQAPPAPEPSTYEVLRADFVAMRAQHAYMAANPSTRWTLYGLEPDQRYVDRQRDLVVLYDRRIAALDGLAAGDCRFLDWLRADLVDGRRQHEVWVAYYAANPEIAARSSEAALQAHWIARYGERLQQVEVVAQHCPK